MAVGDLNSDGKLDLAVANLSSANISVYVASKLDDFSATMKVTFHDDNALRKIGKDFGYIYKLNGDVKMRYKEENKLRMDGRVGASEATYIVKAGSTIKNFADLDQAGVKVVAVNNTTTMSGAQAHLKNAKVTGYETFDEIFNLLKNGEIDAFALSRDQLNA